MYLKREIRSVLSIARSPTLIFIRAATQQGEHAKPRAQRHALMCGDCGGSFGALGRAEFLSMRRRLSWASVSLRRMPCMHVWAGRMDGTRSSRGAAGRPVYVTSGFLPPASMRVDSRTSLAGSCWQRRRGVGRTGSSIGRLIHAGSRSQACQGNGVCFPFFRMTSLNRCRLAVVQYYEWAHCSLYTHYHYEWD